MAKERTNRLKEVLLLAFLSASIILVFSIWASNLIEREFQTPGFYRPTIAVDESFYLTITAAPQKGQEYRGGGEHSSSTPAITPDPSLTSTPSPTEGPDQEN
jgi:hypothetical protein